VDEELKKAAKAGRAAGAGGAVPSGLFDSDDSDGEDGDDDMAGAGRSGDAGEEDDDDHEGEEGKGGGEENADGSEVDSADSAESGSGGGSGGGIFDSDDEMGGALVSSPNEKAQAAARKFVAKSKSKVGVVRARNEVDTYRRGGLSDDEDEDAAPTTVKEVRCSLTAPWILSFQPSILP
jgi:hypothetical protein